MSALQDILSKNRDFGKEVSPVLLVAVDETGAPQVLGGSASGGLMLAEGGLGWTLSGDAVTLDSSAATIDVWSLRVGGASGSIVQNITITYADSSKTTIASVVRTTV
jgi:hypothetical protein